MKTRPLTFQDKAAIAAVLQSRAGLSQVGVSWTTESIITELQHSASLGFFQKDLRAFVLFKQMGSVVEILLIYAQKGIRGAAESVLNAMITDNESAHEIWLEVHEDNTAAIRFYEANGFVRNSFRRSYYPDGKGAFNYTRILKR